MRKTLLAQNYCYVATACPLSSRDSLVLTWTLAMPNVRLLTLFDNFTSNYNSWPAWA